MKDLKGRDGVYRNGYTIQYKGYDKKIKLQGESFKHSTWFERFKRNRQK